MKLDFAVQGNTQVWCGNAHSSDRVRFLLKFLFLFVLFQTYRGDPIGLEDQNKEVFEGEKVGEKRSDMVGEDGNDTNGEERTVLQS